MTTRTVTHNIDAQRYELMVDRQLVGYAQYFATDDTVTFIHTEVLPGHEGKGYGSQLAEGAVAAVRAQHKQVRSSCSFISHYLQTHSDG